LGDDRERIVSSQATDMLSLPMTTRLYRLDAYQTQFASTVLETRQRDDRTDIRLEETAFYPTAGGQACDTGVLAGARVVETLEDDDGSIWHALEGDGPVLGSRVSGEVDWTRRRDHMQQHTGEHMLGQAFYRVDKHVVAVNMEGRVCTIDLAGDVTWDVAMQAERLTNEMIWSALPISTYEIPDTEIERVPLRRTPKVSGLIRVVQIGEFDYSACGGTHLGNSAEVGMLKIFKLEKTRGTDTRVYFNCGARLLSDYGFKHEFVAALGLRFSTAHERVPERTESALEELNAAKREVAALRVRLAQEIAAGISGVVVRTLEDAALLPELAKVCATKPGVTAILGALDGSRVLLAVACGAGATAKAGELLRLGLPFVDGRGGGRPELAQGSGTRLEGLSDALEAMRVAAG
jgi:alanyl-tRNA synthetase